MACVGRPVPQGRIRGDDLLILLLLGTHEQAFERAVDVLVPLAEQEEIVIQHGHTPPRPASAGVTWLEFASYERILELCRAARVVACHAGVGTIMTARAMGKTPLVIPRLARFGEHVDDHQLQIAQEFAERDLVVMLHEADDLESALSLTETVQPRVGHGDALRRAVAEAVG
ncbi:MAG: glycosyltransferase [Gaiellaceae bacterium]